MEAPTINTDPLVSVEAAKVEYRELTALLNMKEGFPQGGSGWSTSFTNRIQDRLTSLRTIIADHIVFGDKKNE